MKRSKKDNEHATNSSIDDNLLQEPMVEYNVPSQLYSSPMPGRFTQDEFMEYLDKAEQRLEEGIGIPHNEALKMIYSWK